MCHQKFYKLIGTDLSRQINTIITQQINFIEKLEEDGGAVIFFVSQKQWNIVLNFSLDSLIATE